MPAAGHISPSWQIPLSNMPAPASWPLIRTAILWRTCCADTFLRKPTSCLALLTKEELDIPFCKQQQRCLGILEHISGPLSNLMEIRKERARRYYDTIFPANGQKYLVFDIGYSGSIATALSAIMGKTFAKLYCWQNEDNRIADNQHGTHTFLLMQGEDYWPYHLILEEMFSPCSGGVVDFDEQGHPCHEILYAGPFHA